MHTHIFTKYSGWGGAVGGVVAFFTLLSLAGSFVFSSLLLLLRLLWSQGVFFFNIYIYIGFVLFF